jgi:hypothetical protein
VEGVQPRVLTRNPPVPYGSYQVLTIAHAKVLTSSLRTVESRLHSTTRRTRLSRSDTISGPHATHLNGRLLARSTYLQCNLDAGLT